MNIIFFSLSFSLLACSDNKNITETTTQKANQVSPIETAVKNICACTRTALTKKEEEYQTQMQQCANLTKEGKQKYNTQTEKEQFHDMLNKCMKPLMPNLERYQNNKQENEEREYYPPG